MYNLNTLGCNAFKLVVGHHLPQFDPLYVVHVLTAAEGADFVIVISLE